MLKMPLILYLRKYSGTTNSNISLTGTIKPYKTMDKTKMAHCPNCEYIEEYEPDEFGLSYFQAVGTCPVCGSELEDENGKPTREFVSFTAKPPHR